jgi:predicted small secreted protein
MKKLIIILALGFISNFSFSQTIKINVTEVVDNNNIDSLESSNRKVNSSYEINLTRKQFAFYKNSILEYEGDITFSNTVNVYVVNFLIDGYETGLIINMDIRNEQVTWFSMFGEYKETSKFTRFEIVKGF